MRVRYVTVTSCAGTSPHFYKWLDTGGTVSRRTANKKLTNYTAHHESAHQKRLIVQYLWSQKSGGARRKFCPALCMCPPLINSFRRHWLYCFFFLWQNKLPVSDVGFGGSKLWAPRTILIMTHADADPSSSASGDNALFDQLQQQHSLDVIIEPHMFRLESHQANGAEMKLLRQTIATTKKNIVEVYLV